MLQLLKKTRGGGVMSDIGPLNGKLVLEYLGVGKRM